MVTKRKLREEVIKLNFRIADLEERLCPCEEHDWKEVDSFTKDICGGNADVNVHKYKCKRCGKVYEVIEG